MQPTVLPAKLPNLLINGSSGIAVGMATNIPPHNLGEVVDATIALIDDPTLTTDELCEIVHGPDFPTGGMIFRFEERRNPITGQKERIDAIREMYAHGRGRIVMRAQVAFEETRQAAHGDRRHRAALPGQQGHAGREDRRAGAAARRSRASPTCATSPTATACASSSRCKRDANPHKVLNNLFKHTPLQLAFSINMLALVDGQPQTLPLKAHAPALHRLPPRGRPAAHRVRPGKARERAHILEGLKIALDNLDAVIRTIRAIADVDTARSNLIARFELSRDPGQRDPGDAAAPPGRPGAQEDRGRVPRRRSS